MDRNNDPAHIRLGINLGSAEDGISAAKLMTSLNEVLSRSLNLVRLGLLAAPVVVQCFFIHDVSLVKWVTKVLLQYGLIGVVCFIAVPEQMYNGMGLSSYRWLFERFYPEIARSNGSLAEPAEPGEVPLLVGGLRINELHGVLVKLRWFGTNRYLGVNSEGWAIAGDENKASQVLLQQVFAKDKRVPDTYSLRIVDVGDDWHQAWLSFQAVNHLRFGGWLGAYRQPNKACPYKVVQDSVCPPGACKLLCASTAPPLPAQRGCTGFYIAEQPFGGQMYVGHRPDRDAAVLELVPVEVGSSSRNRSRRTRV